MAEVKTVPDEIVAERRYKEDVHENIYADPRLLIPTLILIALGIVGFIISIL